MLTIFDRAVAVTVATTGSNHFVDASVAVSFYVVKKFQLFFSAKLVIVHMPLGYYILTI